MSNFLGPIQLAASCLATCKITVSPGAHHPALGQPHSWSLNDGAGIVLRRHYGTALQFDASMRWRLIEDDRESYGPFRVSTLGYWYSLNTPDEGGEGEFWAMHWHPDVPNVPMPHLHLGSATLESSAPVSPKNHLPTSRSTFENAIRWAFEFGAAPARADWADQLLLAESPHLLYRTWVDQHPDQDGT